MDRTLPNGWKYKSPDKEGFHKVISPQNSACKNTWIFRLNLKKGEHYTLTNDELELNGLVISGSCVLLYFEQEILLNPKDSFYLPAKDHIVIVAREDIIMYLGGSKYAKQGSFFTRIFNSSRPLGNHHQVHGEPPFRRDVMLTVGQDDLVSNLITGITIGDEGSWTRWPPHHHSDELEEVFCYFDLPAPAFALHLVSRKAGEVEVVHKVSTGDCIVIPKGYHATVAMPGFKSTYFWVMVARKQSGRRQDLANIDPKFEQIP